MRFFSMGKSSRSSSSSDDSRRRKRRSKKHKQRHRTVKLERTVKLLTSAVEKIGTALNIDLAVQNDRHGSSTRRSMSTGRSRSSRSRSFSVPRGENNTMERKSTEKSLTKETDDGKDPSATVLEINAPNEELIKLLGLDPGSVQKTGDSFRPEVASRWQEIAKSGLQKDERSRIKAVFKPPPNCEFGAPTLNPELSRSILPVVKNRDEEISRVQGNVQVSISGLGNLLSGLLDDDLKLERNDLISKISDAGRFLVGTQYSLSLLRRRLIRENIKDISMKEVLSETSVYPHLFGSDLGTKVKEIHAVTKMGIDITKPSGSGIKPVTSSTFKRKATGSDGNPSVKRHLNSYRPLPSRPTVNRSQGNRSGRYNRH
ncbi:unnamed protein product [Orchesella dallaii]|uniref:Uncharacterized protein n=1 Tax=Orchesella dallaii TaxID=48710 RepID=A0ABP1Q9Q1_9HEXA